MQHLKTSILECLRELKGSGKFADVQTTDFVFPGLQVEGLGEIAFPFQELQARALIQVARKAPFGHGSETILDTDVRSAWEIDADKLSFTNPQWAKFLNQTIIKIKKELGLEEYTVEANLYKLLLYEKGDFFLPHKDSEKESGMFGSLVVGFPSKYTGGELVVRFEGEEQVADFSRDAGNYRINFAAFYADCDHEVKPLESGYRICLVYNLVQKKTGAKIELQSVNRHADKLAGVLAKNPREKPYIILLGHQYTPANFAYERLKLNDRCKAEALLRAAKNLGFYAKLCLITSFKEGLPADSGYYGYEEVAGDDDAEMVEVFDEWLDIEHWDQNELPVLGSVKFEEDDLITSFSLDEDEPIVKESTGYMGNYGPDLLHWYHYGAVVIWSPVQNAQLLKNQETTKQLEWIDYFNRTGQVSTKEIKAVNDILSTGLNDDIHGTIDANYNVVADWLIQQKNSSFFLHTDYDRLQTLFVKIDVASWQKMWEWLPEKSSLHIFDRLGANPNLPVFEKILSIISYMALSPETIVLAQTQTNALPKYIKNLDHLTSFKISAGAISDLMWIENKFSPDHRWVKEVSQPIVSNTDLKYLHKTLAPLLLSEKTKTSLHQILVEFCKTFLQKRAENKPQPPADWRRSLPDSRYNEKIWKMLQSFMESPFEHVFDLKRKMAERSEVEEAIKREKVDLSTTTIRKGSPHTLRISKTRESFERELKKWKKDVNLLKQLMTN